MNAKLTSTLLCLSLALAGVAYPCLGVERIGADTSWTTYEAEAMKTNGVLLGPKYDPFLVETESSEQKCVKLAAPSDFVEFTAAAKANALIVRYSLPDSKDGAGLDTTLSLLVNGRLVRTLALTSRYSRLYGKFPFTNKPADERPRNFYDECRVGDLTISKGDMVRLQTPATAGPQCIIDLVDVEDVAPPLAAPANSLSVLDFGAGAKGETDDTEALRNCLATARQQGRIVWVPAGVYKLTGDINLKTGDSIQGAGMWHTTFVGDAFLYGRAERRVRFRLTGSHIAVADFAIVGRLNYRNDEEPNDGIIGAGCVDSSVSRIWVEHTKVGAWIYNGTKLLVDGCRFRNMLADGINLCVGTSDNVIQECSARGTGDDCFAMWPSPTDQGFAQNSVPGNNVIRHCTGQLAFLANGGCIYGGANNRIEDCLFTDMTAGCGILISSSFPTTDAKLNINNNFSGTTIVQRCELIRCGGYDHERAWRGSLQICMERLSISGLTLSQLNIRDSFSDGLTIITTNSPKDQGTLTNARLENVNIPNFGLGVPAHHALWINKEAIGSVTVVDSKIADIRNDSPTFTVK